MDTGRVWQIGWQVEVSNAQKFLSNKEKAYEYAHELQQQGRNVEVYENGILKDKLKPQEQYSFNV
jgi:hypothetical protein